MHPVLAVALISVVTAVVVTLVILWSWRYRPQMWAADLGLPPQDKVAGAIVAALTVLLLVGGAVLAALAVVDDHGWFGAAIAAWALVAFFGLWDFVVIDWLLFIKLEPDWFHIDGMDDVPHIRDWRHHARESVPALFLGIPIAAIAAAIAAATT